MKDQQKLSGFLSHPEPGKPCLLQGAVKTWEEITPSASLRKELLGRVCTSHRGNLGPDGLGLEPQPSKVCAQHPRAQLWAGRWAKQSRSRCRRGAERTEGGSSSLALHAPPPNSGSRARRALSCTAGPTRHLRMVFRHQKVPVTWQPRTGLMLPVSVINSCFCAEGKAPGGAGGLWCTWGPTWAPWMRDGRGSPAKPQSQGQCWVVHRVGLFSPVTHKVRSTAPIRRARERWNGTFTLDSKFPWPFFHTSVCPASPLHCLLPTPPIPSLTTETHGQSVLKWVRKRNVRTEDSQRVSS